MDEPTQASQSERLAAPRGGFERCGGAKLALAILFSLALAECLLRGALALRVHFGTAPSCGVHPEILGRLLYAYGGGRYSMLSIDSDLTVPDAHRGYRPAPGLRGRNVSGIPVSTNGRGMRGVREYAVPKPPSVVRIVALGDSLTFGDGVQDDATWPAQLEGTLRGTEVVNLGESGYAHDQMYFALLDDGLPLDPDVVVLGFYENDVWRDALTYYCYEKPRFSPGPGGWQVENVPVPSPRELRNRYLLLPLIYAFPRGLLDAFSDQPMAARGGEERAAEILRRMRQRTQASGARFVIVNLPERLDMPAQTHGFFYEHCAKTGAECVDAWPLFQAEAATADATELSARYQLPHNIHYARAGYAIVAEALRLHFTEHPIVPKNTSTGQPVPKADAPPPLGAQAFGQVGNPDPGHGTGATVVRGPKGVPATGQTASYGPGSDGDLQAGRARSFTDNGDGTITDNLTGLMWEKKQSLDKTFVECANESGSCANPHDADNLYEWCADDKPEDSSCDNPGNRYDGAVVSIFLTQLNSRCNNDVTVSCATHADCSVPGGPCGFAGHRDWRLPNQNELLSLVNYQTLNPAAFSAFNTGCVASCALTTPGSCSCTAPTYYWSSSSYQANPVYAWDVNFYIGYVDASTKYNGLFARAVRGGFSSAVSAAAPSATTGAADGSSPTTISMGFGSANGR